MRDLTGRPMLIAGASSGIGAATAVACAAAGMPVALGARRLEQLEAVAERCRQAGAAAVAIGLDVTDPEACAEFVRRAESELGPAYGVFANAGWGAESPVLEMPAAEIRAMFETNLFGTINVLHAAVPGMAQRGAGHALLCSSCLGLFPTPWYSVYSATKAAQHHLGRAMDLELRDQGVRVSTVHPVGTKTEFFERMDERGPSLMAGTSERFMQPPEAVARGIVRCLRKPRPEVWTSPTAMLGMKASALMPRLTNAVLRRVIVKRLAGQAGQAGQADG
ncbi:MAG: SDR family NAD(P)-dependent oxidoreductase [Planctomycetota bacterium]